MRFARHQLCKSQPAQSNCVRAGNGLELMQTLGEGANWPMAEHDFKRVANCYSTYQARTAWVNTNDVFFIGPTGHQAL